MNIEEMHIIFRELAQQMGMQTTRAILSEDIDICLNSAIIDKTKQLIAESFGGISHNDKVARNNIGISPINGLRTLYRSLATTDIRSVSVTEILPHQLNIPIKTTTGNGTTNIMLFTSFSVSYGDNLIYDCRIIENEDLGQTLRDICNRPSKDAPICVINSTVGDNVIIHLYTGRKVMPKPTMVRYTCIVEPAKVYYDEENENKCVNCDLPTYLHIDIVKLAVAVYLQSVGAINSTNKSKD